MCFGIGVFAACGTGVCVCSIDHHFGVNIYHWAARARNKRGIKPVIKWQRHDGCMISKISVWPNVTLKCKQYDILGKASMFLSVIHLPFSSTPFQFVVGHKNRSKKKMNCWKKRFSFKDGKITSFRLYSFKWKRSI